MSEKKVILIIGASRGLGLALAEEYCHLGWHVVATSRGHSTGLDALRVRHADALQIEYVDITDVASVRALRERLDGRQFDTLLSPLASARQTN